MNFLSRLFGASLPPDPDTLRSQLLAVADDSRALQRLCRRHRQLIRRHFDSWRQVPADVREQPERAQASVHGLVAIAQVFAQCFGEPALMQALVGPPGSNPIERWQGRLEAAHRLEDELRYRAAAAELTDLLIDVRGLKGSAVDAYLPITLGKLGECWFQAGEPTRALAPTQQALEHCRRTGDDDGVVAYLGNLYEIHRYLDQSEPAAELAAELAAAFESRGKSDEARRYQNQARLVRAGEPRNRVVAEIQGRRYELEEVLEGIEGAVRFHFERNKLTLRPAQVLVSRGEAAGTAGRHEQALELFHEAARADPQAPHPHYEAAVTLLHLDRATEAIEEYARTEELAPGWFHCRSEMWLAQQMVVGRYDQRLFLLLRVAEDGGLAPEAQRRLVEQGLAQAPDLAPLHLLHARTLRPRPAEAVAACRRGLDCAEEPDVRTRLLVELAGLLAPGPERRQFVEEALALNGNLVAAATARLLAHFES